MRSAGINQFHVGVHRWLSPRRCHCPPGANRTERRPRDRLGTSRSSSELLSVRDGIPRMSVVCLISKFEYSTTLATDHFVLRVDKGRSKVYYNVHDEGNVH